MSRFIVHASSSNAGSKVALNVSGNSVDKVMSRIGRSSSLRSVVKHCNIFTFYSRKTGNLVDVRFQ